MIPTCAAEGAGETVLEVSIDVDIKLDVHDFARCPRLDVRLLLPSGVNIRAPYERPMGEQSEEESGPGIGTTLLSLILGLLAPVLFGAVAFGQGPPVPLILFVAFAACAIYSVAHVSLPSAAAFGFGSLTMSFAMSNIGLGILTVAAMSISLARYAFSDMGPLGVEEDDALLLAPPDPDSD